MRNNLDFSKLVFSERRYQKRKKLIENMLIRNKVSIEKQLELVDKKLRYRGFYLDLIV